MNISALKAFAPAVRRQLMEAITRKLDFVLSAKTPDYLSTFAPQVASLRKLSQEDRSGLIERVAYTWFNRLTALRFLDAKGWHPFGARVLTPASPSETQPEILKLLRTEALPKDLQRHANLSRLNDLLDGRIPSSDPQGEVYRHLVLAACRFYHALLPNTFEKLDDETELLLPDDLLTEHSVVHGFRTEISDEDCGDEQHTNVEILGWLYQFYISERKDQVMARKTAVPTEDIPAVTQLFTPHWIVRYLVENSLGRLWLLNRPGSRLREHMPYYVETEPESDFLKINKPEEIRLLDPAVGSGHMLTYAFDLLVLIYEEEGYAPSEIPALILRHNLYGLEICPRAAQLAELALVFKARENSRRFFLPEHLTRPRIIELREIRFAENELRDYMSALDLGGLFNESLLRLMYQFEEAKNFGSLIHPCLDEQTIAFVRGTVELKDLGNQLFLHESHRKVLRVLEQAEALTQRYHIVIANPPYMGSGQMNGSLKDFLGKSFPQGKADLYSAFLERNLTLAYSGGAFSMITIPNWLFLSSFGDLRVRVLEECHIASMLHNGRGVWGGDFGSVAFVIVNQPSPGRRGTFRRLFQKQGEIQSNEELQANFNNLQQFPVYRASSSDFHKIPGLPIAYWVSETMRDVFESNKPLCQTDKVCEGMNTANNEIFLRYWHEINIDSLGLGFRDRASAAASTKRWFPYLKGGDFRKWYGNHSYVIDWENDGHAIREEKNEQGRTRANIRNQEQFFKESVNWSYISASYFAARISGRGFIFDGKSPAIFAEDLEFVLALLNSSLATVFLSIIDPTIKFSVGAVGRIPLLCRDQLPRGCSELAREAVVIARSDWDDVEVSWDFCDQPLLRSSLKGETLETSWRNWETRCTAAVRRMQELETKNNRLFIEAYGLADELKPDVPENQITLVRADPRHDIVAFLSYAVGCMVGRYSVDKPGLILANAGDSVREFLQKVGKAEGELTFTPDEDGILPVLDGEWFEGDIVARTRDFLRATFGDATLKENIRFVEESLGKDLRKYFLTDFYKDHLQTYKKRPIYWLIQSPRKGFSVLFYLHRYTRDTMNLVLNRYLREFQAKLRSRLAHLAQTQISATISTRDKTTARKEADRLAKTLHECEEWERETLLPLAQARIELDLDDGVRTNYLKLGEALAPIPGLAVAEED